MTRPAGPGWAHIAIAIVAGGATAGLLDILYAFAIWSTRDVAPDVILQSVASGLLGRAAYQGGAEITALGAALHFAIAIAMAAAFVLASLRLPVLARRPLVFGPLYGIGLYVVMNYIVLPLSAFPGGGGTPDDPVILIGGVLAHMFLVGVPIALAARWAATRPV